MEDLLEILEDLHPEIDFTTHNTLIDHQVLDSFDIVSVIAEIDSVYGVTIPAEEIIPENFNSAQALYKLIEKLSDY